MATCRNCAYLRKCIDEATKGGYEHNVDFDPKDGCTGWGFKSNTAADTNADRIRAMSDEELANFMVDRSVNESTLLRLNENHGLSAVQIEAIKHNVYCACMQWLKQPAEVKDDDS